MHVLKVSNAEFVAEFEHNALRVLSHAFKRATEHAPGVRVTFELRIEKGQAPSTAGENPDEQRFTLVTMHHIADVDPKPRAPVGEAIAAALGGDRGPRG